MNKYRKSFSSPVFIPDCRQAERGNAMIYVLLIIALFAALSFILARQGDTSETSRLSQEKTELYATSILQAAGQIKATMDQMTYTGTLITDISGDHPDRVMDFTLPSDAGFNTAPNIHKVFHPEGGGVSLPRLPGEAIKEENTDPAPGWYLGRFNNVEWTQTTNNDVILTAHQISQAVCEEINLKVTGSTTIPVLASGTNDILIDDTLHTGTNAHLNTTECAACEGFPQICVTDGTIFSFYSIVAQQ